MSFQLRLFCDNKEVSTSTVEPMIGAANYPKIGQTIDDRGNVWKVTGVISGTEEELRLRVERIK